MRAALWACALGCLVSGVVVARPAGAAMTLVLRDERGFTQTFHQEGSRVRATNVTNENDGEAWLVDLNDGRVLLVYDDAKAYYDFSKALAQARGPAEKVRKADMRRKRREPGASRFLARHETRRINGFECDLYDRVTGGRVTGEHCLAPWGGAVGLKEDFAWFEPFMQRLAAAVGGDRSGAAALRGATMAWDQGLAVSVSMVDDDGTRGAVEVVTLNRDPLPPAMFQLPADYKESSRLLTASEHPHIDTPRADGGQSGEKPRITGLLIAVLSIAVIIGLSVHAFILHLAASVVIDQARFRQALLASAIMCVVLVAVELMRLPSIVSTAFGAFTTFAALKIAYGASVPRTLALFFVSILIAVIAAYVVHGLLPAP